jgi:hypothetical protein
VVELTPIVGGAAAMLLRRVPGDPTWDATGDLLALLNPALRDAVQDWRDAGGPDGEQLMCLADQLQRSALEDRRIERAVRGATLDRGPVVGALGALAADLTDAGHHGAAEWCRDQLATLGRLSSVAAS